MSAEEATGAGSSAYRKDVDASLEAENVDRRRGLSAEEVSRRRRHHGPNRLRKARRRSAWRILLDQFKSIVVLLLLAAAVLAAVFDRIPEGIAIAVALIINAAIGFFTEIKAIRSMEALQQLGQATAHVRRGGEDREVVADELVPGDIVLLGEGDVVGADLRLIATENLQCDESALTGESVPVEKTTEAIDQDDLPLGDRSNMAFKGTAVTRGAGEGVVVATGMETEIGHISRLVEEAEESVTPLEKRLDALGRRLIWLVLVVAIVIAGAGLAAGKELAIMIETALALAIAAVPEGLPIVATVALGRGMWRMARRNALVKTLSSVETLGATNVIFTDKTGTLTENRMRLRRIALDDGNVDLERDGGEARLVDPDGPVSVEGASALERLLQAAVLCNNAERGDAEDEPDKGDPTEIALLNAGAAPGFEREELLRSLPEDREVSFDTETRMMATIHRGDDGYLFAVKGAPEAVLEASRAYLDRNGEERDLDGEAREAWRDRNEALAADGLRVLGVACKRGDDAGAEPYEELLLLGLVGLYDPPREAVQEAIAACRNAGIRVVMVTGDHPATALSIARAVGIVDAADARVMTGGNLGSEDEMVETRVFARVSPEDKLNLVATYQERRGVVGMTGDGVNDAPALKKADIGIAMGLRGTEVARETSDIVLKDDAFETIEMAIEQGRAIFNSIRQFIVFLLSGNLGQIIAVSLAALINAPLPLLPLQILFINLLLDVLPALALGVGRATPGLMSQPPRDSEEPILTRGHWTAVALYGAVIAAAVLGAFAYALLVLGMSEDMAVTVSFLTFGFARLAHVFNVRSSASGLFLNEVSRNPFVWLAIVISGALLAAAVYVPWLAALLGTTPPGAAGWGVIATGSLAPLVVIQPIKLIRRRRMQGARAGDQSSR